jgi:hypothetical protein
MLVESRVVVQVYSVRKMALAQCRVTKWSRSQEMVQVQRFYGRAAARIRVQEPLQICLGAGAKAKSVTIQLTYIDRVSISGQI